MLSAHSAVDQAAPATQTVFILKVFLHFKIIN